jgi:hypothetical protein
VAGMLQQAPIPGVGLTPAPSSGNMRQKCPKKLAGWILSSPTFVGWRDAYLVHTGGKLTSGPARFSAPPGPAIPRHALAVSAAHREGA